MLKRDGEIDFFCQMNRQFEATPSLEIYGTNNGPAIGINYAHPYFDKLVENATVATYFKAIDGKKFCDENQVIRIVWERLSSWRNYKKYKTSGSYSSCPRVWYCSNVDEVDIELLKELHDPFSGHGFDTSEFETLKKYADQNKGKTEEVLLKEYKQMISDVLKSRACFNDKCISRHLLQLVTGLVDIIARNQNAIVSRSLKIPLKEVKKHPEIKQTFYLIKKLQNITASNIDLLDAFSNLEELVKSVPRYGYNQPLRKVKENLDRLLDFYVS